MINWWVMVLNSRGYPMKVTITAPNSYQAIEQAKALFGSDLISTGAAPCC